MKSLLVVLTVVVLPMMGEVQVTGFVETQLQITAGEVTPSLDMYLRRPIGERWSWSVWALSSESWGEIYAGAIFSPTTWIEVSTSIGIEQADSPTRYAASLWMGRERWSLLSIHEDGGSGYWFKYLAIYSVTDSVAVGMFSQRFVGTGPYIQAKLLGKVVAWGAVTRDGSDTKGRVGLKCTF